MARPSARISSASARNRPAFDPFITLVVPKKASSQTERLNRPHGSGLRAACPASRPTRYSKDLEEAIRQSSLVAEFQAGCGAVLVSSNA
jgi:hypothetical protein